MGVIVIFRVTIRFQVVNLGLEFVTFHYGTGLFDIIKNLLDGAVLGLKLLGSLLAWALTLVIYNSLSFEVHLLEIFLLLR